MRFANEMRENGQLTAIQLVKRRQNDVQDDVINVWREIISKCHLLSCNRPLTVGCQKQVFLPCFSFTGDRKRTAWPLQQAVGSRPDVVAAG